MQAVFCMVNSSKSRVHIPYHSFLFLTVSPDGLLLQSSTVADSTSFQFSDGTIESVPRSYIEFAERLVLPEFKNIPENEVCILILNIFAFGLFCALHQGR